MTFTAAGSPTAVSSISGRNRSHILLGNHSTRNGTQATGEPPFSNQSMPSETMSNFSQYSPGTREGGSSMPVRSDSPPRIGRGRKARAKFRSSNSILRRKSWAPSRTRRRPRIDSVKPGAPPVLLTRTSRGSRPSRSRAEPGPVIDDRKGRRVFSAGDGGTDLARVPDLMVNPRQARVPVRYRSEPASGG